MIIYLIYLHTALLLGLIEPKKTMSAIVRYSYILQTILYRETDYWKANLYDDVKKLDINDCILIGHWISVFSCLRDLFSPTGVRE